MTAPARAESRILRIRDSDSNDKLRVRADYQLGAGTNLIDPPPSR